MVTKSTLLGLVAFLACSSIRTVKGDLTVYTDGAGALASGWENWSWGSDINFAATDEAAIAGGTSISVNSTAYSALSVYYEGTLTGFAGLRFDISGNQPDLTITIQSTVDNDQSPSITLSSISTGVVEGKFSSLLINFSDLPGSNAQLGNDSWNRITFQAGGNGAYYHIDNIVLVDEIVIPPAFLSAEPFATNLIGVTTQGAVNLSDISVTLNGKSVKVVNQTTYVPVDTPALSITYLTLSSAFKSGSLSIRAGNSTFSYTLPAVQKANVQYQYNRQVNPHIYGVNFPTSASYIQHLGVTLSRWGGNAVTAYNPFGDFTNAGADWYFENRAADDGSADAWVGWVNGAGSDALLTIPALDWVAKDTTSYSYPKSLYPEQESFDPYNGEAGDGLFPNGTAVTPNPDQSTVYTPWNTTLAKKWLSGLANKPLMVAVDNEIEIASSTHQDMHPDPMSFDEELARVIATATVAKEALPSVLVVAPSTDSWWFYWTSVIGYTDNAAHNNTDFIPWFLQQMSKQHLSNGKRLLDYLDIHYYFAADTSANDDAAKALRLRMTRSLWASTDPTYVDESWIGTSPPQSHQPNATIVQLIPRFQQLIAQNYPGTKLSISEWSSTNDTDITGGLVTVDTLGIFGKYGVDSATYWSEPSETGPVGLAFWLYRGYGTHFGSISVDVTLDTPLPDTQGLYAATENGKLSLVIVNKNPDTPIAFTFENVPPATYFLRHFGGAAGVAKWQTTTVVSNIEYIVVPAYTAVFLQQQAGKKSAQGKTITCALRATTFDSVPPPAVAILDFLAFPLLQATRAVTGHSVPIAALISGHASSIIRIFDPEHLGCGIGDFGAKIDEEAARLGVAPEEIGDKARFHDFETSFALLILAQVLKRTSGAGVKIAGLPVMYDYEFYPQKLIFEMSVAMVAHSAYKLLKDCDEVLVATPNVFEPESVAAMRTWFSEWEKATYVIGPLLPISLGTVAQSARGSDETAFLDRILNSLLYVCVAMTVVQMLFR